VLQSVVVRCNALQCVAGCCSVLQCVAVRCSALQCVAVCYSVSQCVAVCSVLQCWTSHEGMGTPQLCRIVVGISSSIGRDGHRDMGDVST